MSHKLSIGTGNTTSMSWDEFREFMRGKRLWHNRPYESYYKEVPLDLDSPTVQAKGWGIGYIPDGIALPAEDMLDEYRKEYGGRFGTGGFGPEYKSSRIVRSGTSFYNGRYWVVHFSDGRVAYGRGHGEPRFYVTEKGTASLASNLRRE